MNKTITGVGVLLLIVGLATGYASGTGLLHNVSFRNTPDWFIEAFVATAFIVLGGLMVILGIKKL